MGIHQAVRPLAQKRNQYSRFLANTKRRSCEAPRVDEGCSLQQGGGRYRNAIRHEKALNECAWRGSMTALVLALGLGVGVLVGLLGIGGGVLLVPAMVYLLHMDQHLAQGTSLFILLPPLGLGALREYWKQGQVDLRSGVLCALGMLVGGYAGGLIAVPLDSRQLKGLFGCFLMVAACLLWWKTPPKNESMERESAGG